MYLSMYAESERPIENNERDIETEKWERQEKEFCRERDIYIYINMYV